MSLKFNNQHYKYKQQVIVNCHVDIFSIDKKKTDGKNKTEPIYFIKTTRKKYNLTKKVNKFACRQASTCQRFRYSANENAIKTRRIADVSG